MPRVIGIDPGTVSIDLCGLNDGTLFLDCSFPTQSALAEPESFLALLERSAPLDVIVGPSGYGLPLRHAVDATDDELRLAFLAPEGEPGGIGGLRALARSLRQSGLPVVFTPGVIHLESVPPHRKVNRVDMGTADKVCAAAFAIADQTTRRRCDASEVSLLLLELGGAFTAALAVDGGRIVDGVGGTAGAMGLRGSGALDGEVAFLAGRIDKAMLFRGGVASVAESECASLECIVEEDSERASLAWRAYVESATKAMAAMLVSVPHPYEIVLSGRGSRVPAVRAELERRLGGMAPIHIPAGLATTAKEGAQGAAILADGLAGGGWRSLADTMGVRQASGTVLDHLYVVSADAAHKRLGLA
jgi:predicted butyrate kinase (DUF1464 family)